VAVAVILLLTTGPAATAAGTGQSGPDRVAFGIQPANAQGTVDPRAFFQYELSPAAEVFDHVAVVNYSPSPLDLDVYPTDAGSDPTTGAFSPANRADPPRAVGRWLTVGDGPTTLTVPAATGDEPGTVVLPVRITVPDDASPGDHTGAILVSLTTLGENPDGQNVLLEQRVAVRVYLRITGNLVPRLTISDLRTSYRAGTLPWQAGSLQVRYRVGNAGNVRFGVQPIIGVSGPFGVAEQRRTSAPLVELAPGAVADLTETIDGIMPLGPLDATVRLEALASPGSTAPDLLPVTASAQQWAVPVATLVIVAILLVVWGLLLIGRRRRREATPASYSGRPRSAAPPSAIG